MQALLCRCLVQIRENVQYGNTSKTARHHPIIDLSTAARKRSAPHSQMRLQNALKVKMLINSPHALSISRSIGKFIAAEMRPYSIVKSEGFKQMISTLEPKYKLPSRTYFSDNVIPELYKETRATVLNKLKAASMVSLTTDGWISRATESFVTITAHFIESSWHMRNYVLQTRHCLKLIQQKIWLMY